MPSRPERVDESFRFRIREENIDRRADLQRNGSARASEGGSDGTDDFLDVRHQSIEIQERKLRFDVSVLGQMTTSVALFRSEALLDAKDVSETRQASLEVELRALSEVGGLSVVAKFEESRSAFDLRLDHTGRSHFEKTESLVRLSERAEEGGSDFEDVGRGFSSNDEMSVVGERVGISFLHGRVSCCDDERKNGRTGETTFKKASSPAGALPTTAHQSAVSSWLSGAVFPSGRAEMVPVIWIDDSRVSVRAS